MRCAHFRTALSTRLDGEPAGVPDRRLDKHVARCAACREWLEQAERLRAPALTGLPDGPSAQWSAQLFAGLGKDGSGTSGGSGREAGPGATVCVGAVGVSAGRPGQGDGGPVR
ncbi:zf-HC2 domain-containing protein [Kitasatospora sp. NPDC092286]|uniref:zf-HC2 domain-containing protein n=1 Tax=Kitasatospora sp. NPDC092286 TaxID=3364087 RepID=UPI0037F27AD0